MIPIECPKCGREGNVPPDRLNAKLTCRGCQSVFHMDTSGRMVMGAPGEVDKKGRARPKVKHTKPGEEFTFTQAWEDIPKAAKIGVPLFLVALLAWMFTPRSETTDYQDEANAIVTGVIHNDRAKVVSAGSSATGEAAGKWFDLLHTQIEKQGVPANATIATALFNGNPEKDTSVVMMAVVAGETPMGIRVHMVKDNGAWKLDGAASLTDAEGAIASMSKKPRP